MADILPTGPEPELEDLLAARPQLRMHGQDGLCLEDVPLNAIADRYGTPVWVYGAGTMRARLAALRAAFAAEALPVDIHYAVKANDHLAILNLFRSLGAGADIVSLGEFLRARQAGIAPADIVYSGVGKSAAELEMALAAGIGQINAESAEEVEMISAIAARAGLTACLALRMNPDVDAGTHAKITTGLADNKFGIAAAEIPPLYAHAARLPGIRMTGIAVHIGSQILSTEPYRLAYGKAAGMIRALRAAGQTVDSLDLGGGLGIGYRDEPGLTPRAFAAMARQEIGGLDVRLMMEPGRFLTAPGGVLLASVILEKRAAKRFVVLDAAMNDLMRPAMYEAWHGILPVGAAAFQSPRGPADVVGPVCETADIFAQDRALPEFKPGARVALLDAGAYGAVMSSNYNARPRAAAVLVHGGQFQLITRRQSHEALWEDEIIPALD
ncbi:diaminopimelate decarboxylase [Acidocella sp.]|uniref:diaminopimelate decarboxylase n=1 Tax=Acidocella sp. TaxID=50710 RepID=UPI00261F9CE3|nr:diaminopimelate decarboxylase [Acidocella sp.]